MRVEHLTPGRPLPAGLAGSVLARDMTVGGEHWTRGRRLTAADLGVLAASPPARAAPCVVPDVGDTHEDEAAVRLAQVAGGFSPSGNLGQVANGLVAHGPVQARVDLRASAAGVVAVRIGALERLNRLTPLEVFTVEDGRVVAAGDLVASAKVAPYFVRTSILEAGEAVARAAAPLVRIRPFLPLRVAVVVKESVGGSARERFEASITARVAGLGARLVNIAYVRDEPSAVTAALRSATSGPGRADIVLTAGGSSADPSDAFFAGVDALRGRIVRHGAPAHPGSMLWLARIGRTAVLGLPSCGAYSRATAADLLLPRLVAGYPATAATVAALGHGGVLDRTQRYRFGAYARDLDAPDG